MYKTCRAVQNPRGREDSDQNLATEALLLWFSQMLLIVLSREELKPFLYLI